MNLNEFRREMETYRRTVVKEGEEFKSSYLAQERLEAVYQKLDAGERGLADHVLAEWSLSEDETTRFLALALIRRFEIVSAVPTLETLARHLATSGTVGASYELAKVNRLLEALGRT